MAYKYNKYQIGDIIKGLELISKPYKINGKKDYRVMVKCTLCDKEPYEIVCSEIHRHVYDGCPDCAKRQRCRTTEEFIEELQNVNPGIIVVGTYTSSNNKIECVCAECGHQFSALPTNLLKGHGCKKCADKHISIVQRKSHDDFIKEIQNINSNIEILGTYTGSKNKIKCKCLIDGCEWDALPSHLLKGHGCPLCAGHSVVAGYNDIATSRPDLVKYFKIPDDASKFTAYSNKYADLICPYCGYEKNMLIGHLSKTGFACPICGDGISYPNKFCRQVLKQLPINNLRCEYNPDWAESYLYDNYFEYNDVKYIVEADGIQHFQDASGCWPSFEYVKQTDDIKAQLAINNGCVLIRIDCRKSEMRYIKNSLLNSLLSEIFDLSCVDWVSCEESARSSLVYEVCEFYNATSNKQIGYIASHFGLSSPTIRKYLKIGTNIKICNYKPKSHQIGVIAYHNNDNNFFVFNNVSACARELSKIYDIKIENKGIFRVCRGEQELYKGFTFKFKDGDIYD